MWRKSGISEKIGVQQQEIVWQHSGPEGRVKDGGMEKLGYHSLDKSGKLKGWQLEVTALLKTCHLVLIKICLGSQNLYQK